MILNAWQTLAPTKKFAGMTVEEFDAFIKPSFDARDQLDVMDDQRTQVMNTRDDADQASLAKANQVLAGVAADSEFGDNSSLYEAMGRTRKSERASGLTRKGKGNIGGTTPPSP